MYSSSTTYLDRFRKQRRESFLNTLPAPQIEWFPKSGNEGLYGWTYLPTDGKIRLREDLKYNPEQKTKTDLHESGHTNCELETRLLTDERMSILFPEMMKYLKNCSNYFS